MAGAFRKSVRLVFNLLRRKNLQIELQRRLAEHDQDFIKRITAPDHAGGVYHRQYNEEVRRIREWFDQDQKGW